MNVAKELLNADYLGVDDLATQLPGKLRSRRLVVVTSSGEPMKVILPYDEVRGLLNAVNEDEIQASLLQLKDSLYTSAGFTLID